MGWSMLGQLLLLVSVCNVSSLSCYECFSYVSHEDCENRYNLKEVQCDQRYDTCVKFTMKLSIAEKHGSKIEVKNNIGYGRQCGSKTECNDATMPICKTRFNAKDAHVKTCDIDCCNADLKAECNKRPGWPGTKVSSAIHTNNYTGTINKGQRGVGARLTSSIWCLLLVVSLCVRIIV